MSLDLTVLCAFASGVSLPLIYLAVQWVKRYRDQVQRDAFWSSVTNTANTLADLFFAIASSQNHAHLRQLVSDLSRHEELHYREIVAVLRDMRDRQAYDRRPDDVLRDAMAPGR